MCRRALPLETVAGGLLSFSPASPLPMSPIHSLPRELINVRWEPWETGKEGESEGREEGFARR